MAEFTSYECSKKLWECGIRPRANEEAFHIYPNHSVHRAEKFINIELTAQKSKIFPCYSLDWLIKKIVSIGGGLHRILLYEENGRWVCGMAEGPETFEHEPDMDSPEDAAAELLIKILERGK